MGDIVILHQGTVFRRVTHADLQNGRPEEETYLGVTVGVEMCSQEHRARGVDVNVGHDAQGAAYVYGPMGRNIAFLDEEPAVNAPTTEETVYLYGEERVINGMHLQIVHEADTPSEPWVYPEARPTEGAWRRLLRFIEH